MFPLGNEASEPSGLLNKVFNSTRPCSFPFGKFCVEVLSGDHMAATAIAPSSTQMLVTGSSYAAPGETSIVVLLKNIESEALDISIDRRNASVRTNYLACRRLGGASAPKLHLHSGTGWPYLPTRRSGAGPAARTERKWWQIDYG